jgi:hypothetical protein
VTLFKDLKNGKYTATPKRWGYVNFFISLELSAAKRAGGGQSMTFSEN